MRTKFQFAGRRSMAETRVKPAGTLKWFAIILGIVFGIYALLITALLVAGHFFIPKPPQESKITSDFRAHRAIYEQMRKMILEDKDVDVVSEWGVRMSTSGISKMPPDGISAKRYQDYLALFKEIGAFNVSRGEDPPEVSIGVWRTGFAGESRHVWIAWLDREPPNTMVSLEAFYRMFDRSNHAHVHIEDNWYISADW